MPEHILFLYACRWHNDKRTTYRRFGGHMVAKSGGRRTARKPGAKGGVELAHRCAVIPAKMQGSDGLALARGELDAILSHVHNGILGTAAKGDVLANLWFIRAAHEFAVAATTAAIEPEEKRGHLEFAAKSLLPLSKRIIQALISEKGIDGIWMDDSGLLSGLVVKGKKNPALQTPLRLNALWYSALEITGMALRGLTPMGAAAGLGSGGGKDSSGDHFERLAGRFRRAFTKAYWCEKHQRICPPALRNETHGDDHGALPDAEQLLLMILPESPIPRTKQLGILTQIETQASGPLGVYVLDDKGHKVESLVHRAWLAQALGRGAENETQRQRAVHAARPLEAVAAAARSIGVHTCYKDGKPLGHVSTVATAEIVATLDRFLHRETAVERLTR